MKRALLALLVVGCGAAPPHPCAATTVEVAASLRLRAWTPTDDPTARTPLTVTGSSGCVLEARSDSPWLDARIEGDRLVVDGDPSVGVGVHHGTVSIASSVENVLATVDVTLSVLERAPEDGEPHVLVVGIDGCRPDAVVVAEAPHIDALTALGRSTYTASTQLTAGTISGPGWASILTGVEAEDHLVSSNDDLADVALAAHPTFLFRARGAGLDVALFPQWPGIVTLVEPELAATARVGTGERVAREAADAIGSGADLVFTHFDDVDHAGHATGFDPANPDYVAAIESVDGHVATMVDAILARPTIASERWLVALTTDHGGMGTGHGPTEPVYRTVFVVLADLGGDPATLPSAGVSHMDVGPSVLTHLGVAVDPAWMLDGVAR